MVMGSTTLPNGTEKSNRFCEAGGWRIVNINILAQVSQSVDEALQ